MQTICALPGAPFAPGVPGAPGWPGNPGAPATPGGPGKPGVPGVPMPGAPESHVDPPQCPLDGYDMMSKRARFQRPTRTSGGSWSAILARSAGGSCSSRGSWVARGSIYSGGTGCSGRAWGSGRSCSWSSCETFKAQWEHSHSCGTAWALTREGRKVVRTWSSWWTGDSWCACCSHATCGEYPS